MENFKSEMVYGTIVSVGPPILASQLGEWEFCVNGKDGVEVVRIKADGTLWLNPDVPIDDAARQFWEAVSKHASAR